MTIHYVDFEFNSDFFGINTPAHLELETDVRPESNRPDAEDVEVVVGHKLVVNHTPVFLPLPAEKLAAILKDHLAATVTL